MGMIDHTQFLAVGYKLFMAFWELANNLGYKSIFFSYDAYNVETNQVSHFHEKEN